MEELLTLFGVNNHPFVLLIGAICLALIALSSFCDGMLKLFQLKKDLTPAISKKVKSIDLNRRDFIYGGLAVGMTIFTGYVLTGYTKIKDYFSFVSKPAEGGYLIGNKKTGVIHHSKVCHWHLPDRTNQVLDFHNLKNPFPHNYRNINIYEVMAEQCKADRKIDDAIIYLRKAIDVSPERVHLYDNLAKLYGKQKAYFKILRLYENGLRKIDAKSVVSKNKRQLNKSKNDLQIRIDRIKRRYYKA